MAMPTPVSEEPILSKLDRLDNMLRQLEDIRGCNRVSTSPKSSGVSTPTSGARTSDGHMSSTDDFSPKSLEKHCRPIDSVMLETEIKGTLIERLHRVEDRVLKLCVQFEEELIEEEKTKEEDEKKKSHKGMKKIVKQLLKGKIKHHKSSPE
ncbi:hypothetical protein UlMin_044798 [Ulmus minor]